MNGATVVLLTALAIVQVVIADTDDIFSAAKKGDNETIAVLLADNTLLLESKDKEGNTPLLYAVAGEQLETVQLLVAKGARVTVQDSKGCTPLHVAAVVGNAKIAELLITSGAHADAMTENDITPLHWAAFYGHKEVAQILLKAGASVNSKEKAGNAPLHMAMHTRMQLSKNEKGDTRAILTDNYDVAVFLLDNKAELNALNVKGQTPLDVVLEQIPSQRLIDVLRQRGAKTSTLSGKSAKPIPGSYVGAVQNYEDPKQRIVTQEIDAVNAEIEKNGDFVCTSAGGQKIVLTWKDDRWKGGSKAAPDYRAEASWRIVGEFMVIDYSEYEKDTLVSKARFFLAPRNPQK